MDDANSFFIQRPIASSLLAIGLLCAGILAYFFLPVASLPAVDFPTIRISASQPGADPEIMAATIAAPLERRLGEIAGVTEITSTSSLGSTSITVQFDFNRNIDNAARDVQAAINAAATDLPSDLPSLPTYRKVNPSAAPILTLALTSDLLPTSTLYDAADTIIAQRLAQIDGVAEVSISGSEQPAIRISVDPARSAQVGIGFEQIRNAILAATNIGPLGVIDMDQRSHILSLQSQLLNVRDYQQLILRNVNGAILHLSDIATVEQSVRNIRSAGWYNKQPAVILQISKQAKANVISTVDQINAILPEIKKWIPPHIDIHNVSDRTETIRASISDLIVTLSLSIFLVLIVVFLFLQQSAQSLAVAISIPLSLAGTFCAMWVAGYSLDTLSLMALTISVGFVVDDAIVVVEHIHHHLETGESALSAALLGMRQIRFTVISISLSLIAAFIPLIFMSGAIGRLFSEFALTLCFAIATSAFISLTLTPVICARLMKHHEHAYQFPLFTYFNRLLNSFTDFYLRTLRSVVQHPRITLAVFCLIIAMTISLFITLPKGFFPQDDSGLIFGFTEAASDISFDEMSSLQQKIANQVLTDPAVSGIASFIGASGGIATVNQGRLLINLKPYKERGMTSGQVVARLRQSLLQISGIRLFMIPVQDLHIGGRIGKSPMQFTLWGQDVQLLREWTPRILAALSKRNELVDVSADTPAAGLQLTLVINRERAARAGVTMQSIDSVLGDAYGQKQIATLYTQRNQYRTILTVPRDQQLQPLDLTQLYAANSDGLLVPLSSLIEFKTEAAPLTVSHQRQFPSVTFTYDIAPQFTQADATQAVRDAITSLHLPDQLNSDFAGDAKAFTTSTNSQSLLIIAAFVAVFIILGILYESLAHPFTIISTLPSACLGALLALRLFHYELSLIAIIGIILLIGLVKKNGIMMVDFALAAQKEGQLTHEQTIIDACHKRLRPILMTTCAAMLGAVPLLLATGAGADIRRPLGVTIIGGLILSQALTLYTTPVIYLMIERLRGFRFWFNRPSADHPNVL